MKTSTRIISVAAAVLVLGAGGFASAHQGKGDMGCMGDGMGNSMGGMGMGMQEGGHGGMRGAGNPADVASRLAALKTELGITAEQAPAWQKFEDVARQHADARQAMHTAMQAHMHDPNAAASADHAAQRESMMKQRDTHRAESDAARKALYAVLSPEQKTLAEQRLGAGQGRGHRMAMHRHAS